MLYYVCLTYEFLQGRLYLAVLVDLDALCSIADERGFEEEVDDLKDEDYPLKIRNRFRGTSRYIPPHPQANWARVQLPAVDARCGTGQRPDGLVTNLCPGQCKESLRL